MLTLDTSGIVAAVSRADPYHEQALATLNADPGPWFIPTGILAEITYILESRGGQGVLEDFLQDLESGDYTLDCGEHDIPRIRELVRRYADLRLGFADAAVATCAERHAGQVLTTDYRHFPVVAQGEKTITVAPLVE